MNLYLTDMADVLRAAGFDAVDGIAGEDQLHGLLERNALLQSQESTAAGHQTALEKVAPLHGCAT